MKTDTFGPYFTPFAYKTGGENEAFESDNKELQKYSRC